jgi:hypothetical protein
VNRAEKRQPSRVEQHPLVTRAASASETTHARSARLQRFGDRWAGSRRRKQLDDLAMCTNCCALEFRLLHGRARRELRLSHVGRPSRRRPVVRHRRLGSMTAADPRSPARSTTSTSTAPPARPRSRPAPACAAALPDPAGTRLAASVRSALTSLSLFVVVEGNVAGGRAAALAVLTVASAEKRWRISVAELGNLARAG